MKKNLAVIVFFVFVAQANAQSDSYLTIKDTFKNGEDVHSFSVSGFLARTVLWMADEHAFSEAITDIKNIKLIVIPKEEFSQRGLTVNGFKKILKSDSFQELAYVRDHGDLVTLFHQENVKSKMKDRYFILVEDNDEIIGIELKGSVDVNVLISLNKEVAWN